MILHVLRFLRVGLIIIKDSHLNFDMKYQKISGNTGPYNLVIDMINQERSYLGSMQNRLAFTMSNLTSQTQNIEASRSSIQDTDFAEYPAALEISLLVRIWLTQRASTFGSLRSICHGGPPLVGVSYSYCQTWKYIPPSRRV